MQSCLPVHMAGSGTSLIGTPCKPVPTIIATSPVKDSRWLTLEVCREFARNKCPRSENECRYAHPPSDVEIQTGRVVCCFDSIKGRCQRTNPPCKYLHPPQHLKEQLLQNGRNNLIRRNLQLNAAAACFLPTIYPMFSPLVIDNNSNGFYPSPVVVNPAPINIQYAVSPNYNNPNNVCNNAYLNNTINNHLNNNTTIPAIMPANRNNEDVINNNNPYEFCNTEQQIEKMAYTPSNSSPSLVASPDFSSPQAYWAQPGMENQSQESLPAYYPPFILQVAGSIGGTQNFYPALLKQTMDSINNNVPTTSTATPINNNITNNNSINSNIPSNNNTNNNNLTGKLCSASTTSNTNSNYSNSINNINNANNNINHNNNISFTPIYPCGLQYGNPGLHTVPQQMTPYTQAQHCYPLSISGPMQANTIQRY